MHLRAEQKLVSEEFDKSGVQQVAHTERFEDAREQSHLRRAGVVCRADAEAHYDADQRRDAIEEGADVGYVAVFGG